MDIDDYKKQWRNEQRAHTIYTVIKISVLITAILLSIYCGCMLTGCERESDRVSYNISKQADNFNIVRRVTVIDCITGDVLFQMSGKMSITADRADNQLEILVESDGTYQKHIIGLSDNVTYVVEDLNLGANEVSQYQYKINFNPKMWLPVGGDVID